MPKRNVDELLLQLQAEHYYGWEFPTAEQLLIPDGQRKVALDGLELYITFLQQESGSYINPDLFDENNVPF